MNQDGQADSVPLVDQLGPWQRIMPPEPPGDQIAGIAAREPACIVTPDACQTMFRHAHAGVPLEVGGLLLGGVLDRAEDPIVYAAVALPARFTRAAPANITFSCESWLDLERRRATAAPEWRTIGWYHSHPGWGIFLSAYDRFIHQAFFADCPWYVAVVVDPTTGALGTFGWRHGQIMPIRTQIPLRQGQRG